MLGDNVVSNFIDSIFSFITNAISKVINVGVGAIFLNIYFAFIIFLIAINIIAILLVKRDKELAKIPEARRIRESTLLTTAFIGGAIGEYYAMYKYKHKTLHKKFIYGVPLAIVFHFSLLAYYITLAFLKV